MPTYGYNRSITRVGVNPRLAFGVPLDKLCLEGRLHPGLRDLFLKAHLCADSEDSLGRKKNQPEDNLDASHTVLKLLEARDHGLGTSAERLSLKTRLEAGEWIVATPTSPGAPLWLLEHFLGCLPSPIFGEKIWRELSEECKEYVEKTVAGSSSTCYLIQKLAKCLNRLSVGEFLTVAALMGLMRNLATDGRTADLNKTAVMALVRFFVPSLVSRPYRPGSTSSEAHKRYPLLLFLCYYWPEIREQFNNISQESHRTSRWSSLTSIQQKMTETIQKKCMSLPNSGVVKQRAERQKLEQSFDNSFLPTNIPHRCIYLYRNKPNHVIRHKPQCIWKPIFLEKDDYDPNFSDDKNVFKPASLFICTCCGKCSEKVDQETQCDESILLHQNESSEKHEKSTEIQFEYVPRSSSINGNCGSEREFLDVSCTSAFGSNNILCPCCSSERDANDSNKTENKLRRKDYSQCASVPHLLKAFPKAYSEIPFYTKGISSVSCLDDVKPILTENLKVSIKTEEKTAFCSAMKGNTKASTSMDYLCNKIIGEKDGKPISESSTSSVLEAALKSRNKWEHTYTAPGQDGNNVKSTYYKSTEHNQPEGEDLPFAGRLLKPLSEDDRCHTELFMSHKWERNQGLAVKQNQSIAKSNTYPLQSSSINKDVFAVAGADAADEHPRRSSESSALPRSNKSRFKPKQWLREAIGQAFRRTSSSHSPHTFP